MSDKIIKVPCYAKGQRLSEWLIKEGYSLSAACGGRGVCGKCRVKPIKGKFLNSEKSNEILLPDKDGYILSCRAICGEEASEIILPCTDGSGLVDFSRALEAEGEMGFGIAFDIGTTTLASALVDRKHGKIIDTFSCLNPQRSFGADVISRISASDNGHLEEMHTLILDATKKIIDYFSVSHPEIHPEILTVSGNTTMLHLFAGVSPKGMGAYPFTPAFTEMRIMSGDELSLPIERIIILPSASAFIGSDITGGIVSCGMKELDKPSILIDIGTNGEMVLCLGKDNGNKIFAASAAAGPAMEGANISCGVGGIDGAVCRIEAFSDMTEIHTINDKKICGICGSGLVDIIALMLKKEAIDETGYLEDGDYVLKGTHLDKDNGALSYNEPEISVTQKDVREFQLAKSAISAGLEALIAHASLKMSDINRIFIAGGLGYYMNVENAGYSGLIPAELCGKTETVGNTSLSGAISCLCGDKAIDAIVSVAAGCETVELNKSKVFNEAFINNMIFDI